MNEFQLWIAGLLDARITVGDTVVYGIVGFVVVTIAKAIRAWVQNCTENRRKAWLRQYGGR